MNITIELDLNNVPLSGRRCGRCKGTDFREVRLKPQYQRLQCADCMYQSFLRVTVAPCGRVVQFLIGEHSDTVWRCGDMKAMESPSDESQTAVPLAVCLGCKRLVALQ